MLKELNVDQARFVALLAKAVRAQRDDVFGNVAEAALSDLKAARGEHNPTATLGFDPVRANASQTTALREAVASLSPIARAELYTLMRIGQRDLASAKWHRGMSEAALLGDATIVGAVLEDADLHNHLMKGLYEADLIT